MDETKRLVAEAFQEIEEATIHPSDEEIAAAIEGTASLFGLAEVRAHLGWCGQCAQTGEEFREFSKGVAPAAARDDDQAWRAMKQRLPAPSRPVWTREWMAAAAGFALCSVLAGSWWATHRTPVIDVVPVVTQPKGVPLLAGNAPVIDLYPAGIRLRAPNSGEGSRVPDPVPQVVTFVLNGAKAPETKARLLDAQGGELWSGVLQRQGGVYTLALGDETLRLRPLTIELGEAGTPIARYTIAANTQ